MRHGRAWLRSRFKARALVLGYHRLDPPREDPFRLSVSPETFRAHLRSILHHARPVRLPELLEDLRTGSLRARSVVMTFDDAHAGTMDILEPILREHGVPATVFAPTALLGVEPWWERLQRVLSTRSRLPSEIALDFGGATLHRRLSESERDAAGPAGARNRLIMDLYGFLMSLPDDERTAALDRIEPWAGAQDDVPAARVATADELAALDRSEWIDVGSHSATHPFLAGLPEARRRDEIESSYRALEEILGHPVDAFSYPNGSRDTETDRLVEEAGYRGACASHADVVTATTGRFALPRFWPTDDAAEVDRILRRWVGTG